MSLEVGNQILRWPSDPSFSASPSASHPPFLLRAILHLCLDKLSLSFRHFALGTKLRGTRAIHILGESRDRCDQPKNTDRSSDPVVISSFIFYFFFMVLNTSVAVISPGNTCSSPRRFRGRLKPDDVKREKDSRRYICTALSHSQRETDG